MNLNHLLNAMGTLKNSSIHKNTQMQTNSQSPPLYPTSPNFDFRDQNFSGGQDFNQQQSNSNSPNFASIIQLLSLFSKKQDTSSLINSTIGQSFGINENVASILNLLGNKKNKMHLKEDRSTLPKIDTLERVK